MNISLSTPLLVVILVAVLILTLIAMRISGGPRTRRSAGAPGKGAEEPAKSPLHNIHPNSGHGDKGAEVAARYGHTRSPEWPEVARAHLKIQPACMACGYEGEGLQVHHIKPFHLFPDLELDPTNLITLCEIKGRDHHLLIGHLDNWESYNLNVHDDAKRFYKENAAQIRANPTWQKEEVNRPVPQR